VNRILIVTAVEAEAEAVRRGLPDGPHGVTVLVGGVGSAWAAAATSRALALDAESGYEAVLSVGIGGGFRGKAELGGLLLARRVVVADLGADSPDGFLSVDGLGFGSSTLDGGRVPGLDAVVGTILTVNTVTGTDERAAELMERHPAAVGEAMEGYGVAAAAALAELPFAEVRAVSNLVGKRDRDAWRLDLAFAALTAAVRPIAEGLEAC
jgi:futalosine hydrolase